MLCHLIMVMVKLEGQYFARWIRVDDSLVVAFHRVAAEHSYAASMRANILLNEIEIVMGASHQLNTTKFRLRSLYYLP